MSTMISVTTYAMYQMFSNDPTAVLKKIFTNRIFNTRSSAKGGAMDKKTAPGVT